LTTPDLTALDHLSPAQPCVVRRSRAGSSSCRARFGYLSRPPSNRESSPAPTRKASALCLTSRPSPLSSCQRPQPAHSGGILFYTPIPPGVNRTSLTVHR
jgi:hypothetical protein